MKIWSEEFADHLQLLGYSVDIYKYKIAQHLVDFEYGIKIKQIKKHNKYGVMKIRMVVRAMTVCLSFAAHIFEDQQN
jgi:hypothetical protein